MQLTDLPRDPYNTLNGIRRPLMAAVNSARHSKTKRMLMLETLECMCVELRRQVEAAKEPTVEIDEAADPIHNIASALTEIEV